jgi:hypothetical protein
MKLNCVHSHTQSFTHIEIPLCSRVPDGPRVLGRQLHNLYVHVISLSGVERRAHRETAADPWADPIKNSNIIMNMILRYVQQYRKLINLIEKEG